VELLDKAKQVLNPVYTWNDAVVRYLKETEHKSSHETDKVHLRWLDKHLGGVELDLIKRDLLDKIGDAKKAEGVQNSTINRVLELVRAILRKACDDWEWLIRVPSIRHFQEPKKRVRWLTYLEAERLIVELPSPLSAMCALSLETGLRRGNVTGLQWTELDLARKMAWVHPDEAKAGVAIGVPLSDKAVEIIRGQIGKHLTHVFSYRGKPITQTSTKCWYDSLKRAGISNFRWHDLRHTWASWHVQRGTPLVVLKELGGWAKYETVLRYAHLNSEHLAQYVNPPFENGYITATLAVKRG
jgi:integrase